MYTAEELIWATQLAYCNFVADDLQEGKTIRDIVSGRGEGIYYNYDENATPTGDKKTMRDETIKFIEAIKNGEICQNWKVISVYDRQDQEGTYGIMIDTGNDEAIIAFRGSESVNTEQRIKDWLAADFEIINGTMTDQERAACRYLDKITNNKAFNKYQNIAVTGHSLGGDLALVSTIYTATDECTTDMASRIKQSVSMDGPGHPKAQKAMGEKLCA